METDALLVRRAASGDADAFEALVQASQHRIYALCLRMTGSPQDVQDLAQEALLRIYRSLSSFREQANFDTWAYRIATNACIDELRRRKRSELLSMEALQEAGHELPSQAPCPEEAAIRRENLEELQRAILQLPADQRAAVVLRDVQGLSYEQVANALDLNLNTVKSRICRGRQRLQGILSQHRNNCAKLSSNG